MLPSHDIMDNKLLNTESCMKDYNQNHLLAHTRPSSRAEQCKGSSSSGPCQPTTRLSSMLCLTWPYLLIPSSGHHSLSLLANGSIPATWPVVNRLAVSGNTVPELAPKLIHPSQQIAWGCGWKVLISNSTPSMIYTGIRSIWDACSIGTDTIDPSSYREQPKPDVLLLLIIQSSSHLPSPSQKGQGKRHAMRLTGICCMKALPMLIAVAPICSPLVLSCSRPP